MQLAWQLAEYTLSHHHAQIYSGQLADNEMKRFTFLVISNVYTSLEPWNKILNLFLTLLKQPCSPDDHTPDLITFVLIKAQHLFQLWLARHVFFPLLSVPPMSALISRASRKRSVTCPTLQTFALFCSSVIIFWDLALVKYSCCGGRMLADFKAVCLNSGAD